jgi:hypothetical protein
MNLKSAIKLMSKPGKKITRQAWMQHPLDMVFFISGDGCYSYNSNTPGAHWGFASGGGEKFSAKSLDYDCDINKRMINITANDWIELSDNDIKLWKQRLIDSYLWKNMKPTGPTG